MSNIVEHINNGNLNNCCFMQLIKILDHLETHSEQNIKVKFISSLNLRFPESEVEKIAAINNKNGTQIEVTIGFLGIAGTTGVLPSHYTQHIQDHKKQKDSSLSDFINIFYNRIIKLFINIIKVYDVGPSTSNFEKQNSNLSGIYNLIGITPSIALKYMPNLLLSYSGALLNASRSALVLENILSCYLRYPVKIEQFIQEKVHLGYAELSMLGKYNSQLGSSLYIGEYAYFNQNKILIKISDLNFNAYSRFVHNKALNKNLDQILRFYVNNHINYEIIFFLLEKEKFTQLIDYVPRKLGVDVWCKG
jgi:type VI secretion system protein ImpH